MQTATAQTTSAGNINDEAYDAFLARIQQRFWGRLEVNGSHLFTTDATGLWDAYLGAFPETQRQFHNCNACRHFIDRFGGLVVITADGSTVPAIWMAADTDPPEHAAIVAMERIVQRAKVTGVFLSSAVTLGTCTTGVWQHLALDQFESMRYRGTLLTAGQAMAEKREDHKNVSRALADFKLPTVEQALTLLKSDQLYRSEKVLGAAQWLFDLHVALKDARYDRGVNLIWKAVAAAPAGFCHPRSSMIGTLLEDIESGMDFSDVSKRFAAKMHPLHYQRPQAAPSAGNIAQAEKLVEKLGITNSLRRRFARLDEVQTIWLPKAQEPEAPAGGVFWHLTPKGAPESREMHIPATTITWEKFARTVLPEAVGLELMVPGRGNFTALVTAADSDAPPIIQWDSVEQRNPFSLYVYNGGSDAQNWGLAMGQWCKVTGITSYPAHWHGREAGHHARRAILLLEGAKDGRYERSGNALFPEILRNELREIRSTIEAYSRKAQLEGFDRASACGLCFGSEGNIGAHVRVTTSAKQRLEYRIDRMD